MLREEVARASWYHTIELPGGVITPGEYDHRKSLPHVLLPRDLTGKRCLDVGVRDGFWAFHMEDLGAEQVVGIDLDDPASYDWPEPRRPLPAAEAEELERRSRTFDIASRARGSKVKRVNLSVYELTPEQVGTFDFAMIGTLLLHLRDPVGALIAVRRVLSGELLVNEPISATLSVLRPRSPAADLLTFPAPFWWYANRAGMITMVRRAGYEILDTGGYHFLRRGPAGRAPSVRGPNAVGKLERLVQRGGLLHMCIRARPSLQIGRVDAPRG